MSLRHKGSIVANEIPPTRFSKLWRPKKFYRHERLRPEDYRNPAILRTFIKDKYLNDIQHIENRGMYAHELDIERGRLPNTQRCLTIGTDGALNEREFEYVVPPLVPLFNDRALAYKMRTAQLAKVGKLRPPMSWAVTEAPPPADVELCNALEFPYAVPRKIPMRNAAVDPLNVRGARQIVPE